MVNNDNKSAVFPPIYACFICDVKCCKKSHYNEHLKTIKHQKKAEMVINGNLVAENGGNNLTYVFSCICDRRYKYLSGLSRHKKTCEKIHHQNKVINNKDLILTILKDNSELKTMILDVCKNITISNITNNNVTNNKTFNLHVYLNEDCKDALNISDFVSSIKVELEDLEETGRLGYVEGVSRIINRNLGDLDQNKRPIQCSDLKREVLYIKNDDQWTKEGDEIKPILKKAIKEVANENIKQISEWRKKYPDCTASDSRKNDQYLKIVSNAMAGMNSEEHVKNVNKIISNVAKETVIEK
jgi:hypothetical protein